MLKSPQLSAFVCTQTRNRCLKEEQFSLLAYYFCRGINENRPGNCTKREHVAHKVGAVRARKGKFVLQTSVSLAKAIIFTPKL